MGEQNIIQKLGKHLGMSIITSTIEVNASI